MRFAMLLLVGTCLAAPLTATSVQGATLRPPGIETDAHGVIEAAGHRCGRGYHWVSGHRTHYGQWVKGYCTRNRHR